MSLFFFRDPSLNEFLVLSLLQEEMSERVLSILSGVCGLNELAVLLSITRDKSHLSGLGISGLLHL